MKTQNILAILLVLTVLCSPFAVGAVKYGRANIEKGNVVIVREGRMYLYTKTNSPVTLYENDTIRTLKNTSLTLFNPDQHKVRLGANAVMQLRKWKKKRQQGTLRMLFGKFRARTAAVRKKSSLYLRTTTATIGIKGSLGDGATSADFTMLKNKSGAMSMINNAGQGLDIPVGQFGYNVDGLDKNISLEVDEDYEPGKSEDEMETSDTEQLDTEDTKEVDVPPVVEEAIQDNVVEVADASEVPDEEDDTDLSDLPEPGDILDDVQEEAANAGVTIDATITIED
jgi:hypothetical protein